MPNLAEVFKQQWNYNKIVFGRQERKPAEWMETYILGLLSEAGQLLDSMRWKRHRPQTLADFGPNVPEELADLTKYVFSMWLLMGFTPEQMLDTVYAKGELLRLMFTQDYDILLKTKVILFDLDDVLADLKGGLKPYLAERINGRPNTPPNIHLDIAEGYRYDDYRAVKQRFEEDGGYATLAPLVPIETLFRELRRTEFSIVVFTARPVVNLKRVQRDTFAWFQAQGSLPDVLRFGREERIGYALKLQEQGHQVLLIDDNPETCQRSELSGVPTYLIPADNLDSLQNLFNQVNLSFRKE